jgi:hypothetical protein
MFDQLLERSDAVRVYSAGRFAEERRTFVCGLIERGYGLYIHDFVLFDTGLIGSTSATGAMR